MLQATNTVDLSAIAKWPNVPACYDWLSLDRRGDWRLQGERVTHHGFIALLNRQYGVDEHGCWFVQNGPQRVFVRLGYTPWVFRYAAEGLLTHTGVAAGVPAACFLDEEGSALISTELGVGLLDDRDLPTFLDECRQEANIAVDEGNWLKILAGENTAKITWRSLPLQTIRQSTVAEHFNFRQQPQP
jgi:hypothetical protein